MMACERIDRSASGSFRCTIPLSIALAFLGLFACAVVFAPSRAYATYADYDTDNPAEQSLGSYGDPIYASDIPDGVYEVNARTSSSMCILYRTEEEALVRDEDNKEKCYIGVSGDTIVVEFYISSMYNRLYMGGTAQDAASLTNEDGTDDSQYLRGEPVDGYTPHFFRINISSLNTPLYFASFAGGDYPYDPDPNSTWNTRAKWYSRTVVFTPTDELLQAIEDAKNGGGDEGSGSEGGENDGSSQGGENDGENEGGSEGGGSQGGENGGDEGGGSESRNGAEGGESDEGGSQGGENDGGDEGSGSQGGENGGGDAGGGSQGGNGAEGGESDKGGSDADAGNSSKPEQSSQQSSPQDLAANDEVAPAAAAEPAPEEQPSEDPAPEPVAASQESIESGGEVVRYGVLIRPVALEEEERTITDQSGLVAVVEQAPGGLRPEQIVILVLVALACAGIAWRTVTFNVSKRHRLSDGGDEDGVRS